MNTSYVATLEDLAAKRRGLADVIVALAKVAGVDPAPYLDAAPSLGDQARDAVRRLHRMQKPAKEPAPPRPQRPASPSTNGTGRANKVESEHASKILDALKRGPTSPGALGKLLGMTPVGAMYHVKRLASAGTVTITGARQTRRVALA